MALTFRVSSSTGISNSFSAKTFSSVIQFYLSERFLSISLVKQSSNSALDSRSRQLGEGEHFDGRVPSTNLIVSAARSVPITLTIDIAEPMGSESLVYLKAGTGNLIARIHREHLFHLGEQVTVRLDMEKVSLFDVETEQVIRWGLRRPSALSY